MKMYLRVAIALMFSFGVIGSAAIRTLVEYEQTQLVAVKMLSLSLKELAEVRI